MGVYVKNMEMPNKKNGAVLIIYPDGKCAFEDGKTYQAVPVPPHGRLIDADVLTTVTEMVNGEFKTYIELFEIADAPTIIESEEEDG